MLFSDILLLRYLSALPYLYTYLSKQKEKKFFPLQLLIYICSISVTIKCTFSTSLAPDIVSTLMPREKSSSEAAAALRWRLLCLKERTEFISSRYLGLLPTSVVPVCIGAKRGIFS